LAKQGTLRPHIPILATYGCTALGSANEGRIMALPKVKRGIRELDMAKRGRSGNERWQNTGRLGTETRKKNGDLRPHIPIGLLTTYMNTPPPQSSRDCGIVYIGDNCCVVEMTTERKLCTLREYNYVQSKSFRTLVPYK